MSNTKLNIVLASLFVVAVPSVASAQSGAEVGVRTGYAFSAGHTGALANRNDQNLGDSISGQWPIWLDAGFRFHPNWYVGGYFQYGFGFVNDDKISGCRNSNVDCSASDTRLGLMLRYQFAPLARFAPWVGYGFGYEWTNFSIHQTVVASTTTDQTSSGFEFANLQVGVDYAVASRFVIAPFISLSFGQYRHVSSTTTDGSSSVTSDDSLAKESVHEWFLIGVRAALLP